MSPMLNTKKKYLELIRNESKKALRNSFNLSLINITKFMDCIEKDVETRNIDYMQLNILILDKFDDLYHLLIEELDSFIEKS